MPSPPASPAPALTYRDALDAFLGEPTGWETLPFFADGTARAVCGAVDGRVAAGARVLPAAADVFNAFRLTPREAVRAVILGQDPYPTPGDAHGLAFSVRPGVATPRSLANIFREYADDLGLPPPRSGDLRPWARAGVLLLNAALTVEAGAAGAHRKLGWARLADDAVRAVSAGEPSAFVLWGADAQARAPLVDASRHLVHQSVHPSPLSARRGFFGSKPFSRVNAFLRERGRPEIDWSL